MSDIKLFSCPVFVRFKTVLILFWFWTDSMHHVFTQRDLCWQWRCSKEVVWVFLFCIGYWYLNRIHFLKEIKFWIFFLAAFAVFVTDKLKKNILWRASKVFFITCNIRNTIILELDFYVIKHHTILYLNIYSFFVFVK